MSESRDVASETIAHATIESLTPMLRQYYDLKDRCGDAILFFRMGDFFEIFGADAERVAPLLELVLTSRERGDQQRIPFCGVPHHSARNYWLKLLKKGFKVAIADQLEDPAEAKGLVKRDIVRTLTPSSIDDLEGLDRDAPNYLMGIYEEPGAKSLALAVADLSTGEMRLGRIATLGELRSHVERLKPKELLARRFVHDELKDVLTAYCLEHRLLIEPLPEAALRDANEQESLLTSVLGSSDLTSQPCGGVSGGAALLSGILTYFKGLNANLGTFMTVRPLAEQNSMQLDETAVRDLELFETVRRRHTEGSLFKEINRTLSPMGARLLRYFLAHPLLDAAQIKERHKAVGGLLRLGDTPLQSLRHELKHLADLERLATRIVAGSASPIELAKTRSALQGAHWVLRHVLGVSGAKLNQEVFKAIGVALKLGDAPRLLLESFIADEPRALGTGNGVFREGCDVELDRLNALARSGESKVEAYQEGLRDRTGISSLKVKHHKAFGLLIEVTKPNLAKVPKDFIRRQTMVNCERFTTVELNELNETLSSAQENALRRESELYVQLLTELAKFRSDLKSVAEALATFDMLQSFAWQALKHHYTEPKLSTDDKLELSGSRHPVVERFVGSHAFTPNDVSMSAEKKHLLITGPNMAGKSTVMRQTAIAAILCQIGSFVPAQSAKLPVFDRIFTRVGAADDLSRGQSTFMVEMSEAASILRNATHKSLVILDEVGRGTSTQDGLALASAILVDLARRIRCYSLFATHYHEIVPLAHSLPAVRVMQTEVLEHQGRIKFSHLLKEGASGSSYGLEVARIAGLPESVLAEAERLLQAGSPPERTRKGASAAAAAQPQVVPPLEKIGLSAADDDLRERLARLDLNRLTPIQVFNIIAGIQAERAVPIRKSLFQDETC